MKVRNVAWATALTAILAAGAFGVLSLSQPRPLPAERGVSSAAPWANVVFRDTRTGTPFRLADFQEQGRPTVIVFTASWCVACKPQAAELKQVANVLGRSIEIVFLDVDRDETSEEFAKYADEKLGALAEWRFALDKDRIWLVPFGVQALPTLAVIDKNGAPVVFPPGVRSADSLIAYLSSLFA